MKIKDLFKKYKLLFFLAIIGVFGLIGGTFAFFFIRTNYENEFKVPKYGVAIEEEFYNEFGTKNVYFVNKQEAKVAIRVSYNEIWKKIIDDENISLNNKINDEDIVIKSWTDVFLNDFTYNKNDGWYYYNKVLKGGTSIQVLSEINLNEDLLNSSNLKEEYINADYELDFNLESVQLSKSAIKEIWDVEPNIEGEDIEWPF